MSRIEKVLRSHLKLRHLQLLVVLDELRHLSRTAEYLRTTQPAISKTLKEIEDAFGTQLFERSSKGTTPTKTGAAVVGFARKTMVELEKVGGELALLKQGVSPIRIGAMGATIPLLLARGLREFKAHSPEVTVSIEEGFLDALLPRLRVGEFDFVLGRLEPRWISPEFRAEPFYDEAVCVVASVGHALVGRDAVTWEELAREPWVIPQAGSPARMRLDRVFEDSGVAFPVDVVETTSILAVIALLSARQMVGLLTASTAHELAERGAMRVLPISMPAAVAPVGALLLRQQRTASHVQALLSALRAAGAALEQAVAHPE